MARFKDREKALALRKQEMSYSQIKEILGISKSTLSGWLRNYPLSKARIDLLRGKNEKRIEKYRETMRGKRNKRLLEIYKIQKKKILPLNKRELFLAGLMLYWGEGTKRRTDGLSVSNTDPSVIKFFIYWIKKIFSVQLKKLKVQIHLYNDMDIKKEISYWSEVTKISPNQFTKPYIKQSSSKRIHHKGGFGHGTCNVRINDVSLGEKTIMSLKAISDYYSNKRP